MAASYERAAASCEVEVGRGLGNWKEGEEGGCGPGDDRWRQGRGVEIELIRRVRATDKRLSIFLVPTALTSGEEPRAAAPTAPVPASGQ